MCVEYCPATPRFCNKLLGISYCDCRVSIHQFQMLLLCHQKKVMVCRVLYRCSFEWYRIGFRSVVTTLIRVRTSFFSIVRISL